MTWLLPSIIACLAGSVVLVWVYGFLYGQYRERHIGLWTCGWIFYTLRFVLQLLDLTWLPWVDMQHLVHACVLLSGYYLFLGTAEFVNKPVGKGWHRGLILGLLWIPVSHLADLGFFLTNLPIFFFYGLISIWTGLLILRAPDRARGGGHLVTGGSFILWGLHKFDYPFLQPIPWFSTWGFLLSAVLSFVVAIGMLLIYFQRMRNTLQQRELSLQLSQEKYQGIFDQSFQLVGLLDPKGTLLEINQTALGIKETTSDQVLGKPFWDTPWWTNIPGGRERVRQAVQQAARGELVRFEVTDQLADGRILHVDFSLKPIRNAAGEVVFLIPEGRDITERKQTEEALRTSETRYQLLYRQFQGLLDGIPDLLLLFAPDLRVVWANRSAHQLGGELRVLEGAACHLLQEQWGIPCDVFMLVDAFSWGRTEEGRVATPDGRSWGVKAFPIRDDKGTVSHAILWASDITEKSRLRDEAMRATRLASLGELAAGMAHEINNPNGLILLNLPLLIDCFDDALREIEAIGSEPELGGLDFARVRTEVPESLREVQQASRRIKRIVEDLKDFVRLERSDEDATFQLNDVVQTATRLLANPIKTATDRFVLRCVDGLPAVRGSFQRIEQVVVNLVMNACQALPDRQRRLQLSTDFDPNHGMVTLQVEDEGSGIEPADLPHLTDPFFTTRRDQGGTGLGLSVSARIVREHDGQLEFNSTPGRGTIVTLRLPAAPKEDSP